jgi:hypothetical protein
MRNAYFLLVVIALLIAPALDRAPPKRQVSLHFAPSQLFVFNLNIRF